MFKTFKIWAGLAALCLALSGPGLCTWAQDSNSSSETNFDGGNIGIGGGETLAASIPREALERLANLTQDEGAANMWILVPSNLSESQLHESNFALFKLNTGQLFNLGGGGQQLQAASDWTMRGANEQLHSQHQARLLAASQTGPVSREARKLGLFSNVLTKPKVSPLYLVNGTVCRFVNSQPICTTLSTTGLFRNPNQGFLTPQMNNNNQNSGFFSNLNNNNNNQQQQQQQFPNSRQVTPQQNNFQQPQQQGFQQNITPNQQFRPAALMEGETQAVNLTNSSLTGRQQPVVTRPMSYTVINRRPLSLLSLTRPFRSG